MSDAFRFPLLLVAAALAAAPARAQEKEQKPVDSVTVVPAHTLGGTLDTLKFVDAAATPDGHRTQFDPIPDGVAFEAWLEGMPRKVYVTEPGATEPVQKPCVSVLSITDAEWDEYVGFLTKETVPADQTTFHLVIINSMLDQKATLLNYRDELDAVERRSAAPLKKLSNGQSFTQVVRVHSEDDTTARIGGLYTEDTKGGLLGEYPFSKSIFELKEGEVAGPFFQKNAAYILHLERFIRHANPWFDRAKVSAVVIRYTTGPGAHPREIGEVRASMRVRTNEPRFQRLLPPGLQVPTPPTFGPDDIAPAGSPDTPLKRLDD